MIIYKPFSKFNQFFTPIAIGTGSPSASAFFLETGSENIN